MSFQQIGAVAAKLVADAEVRMAAHRQECAHELTCAPAKEVEAEAPSAATPGMNRMREPGMRRTGHNEGPAKLVPGEGGAFRGFTGSDEQPGGNAAGSSYRTHTRPAALTVVSTGMPSVNRPKGRPIPALGRPVLIVDNNAHDTGPKWGMR